MTFFEAVKSCYRAYATFGGRASRKEFWYFTLYGALVTGIFGLVALVIVSTGALGAGFMGFGGANASDVAITAGASFVILLITVVTYVFWLLATLIPYLAANVRRLRDAGFSGWFILLHLLPFGTTATYILCVFPSRNKLFVTLPGDRADNSQTQQTTGFGQQNFGQQQSSFGSSDSLF